MDFDISHLLDQWEFRPGQVLVRRFRGRDGSEKIQLRVDLGLLQMNLQGRPDGKRPYGFPSLFEYYQSRLYKHVATHEGEDAGFRLGAEDCAKLQLETLQYHQRCFCLLQLEEYAAVVRDAERNLAVLNFVSRHAGNTELAWSLGQFEPQIWLVLSRAKAAEALAARDHALAIEAVEEGLEHVRAFFREHGRPEAAEQSGEVCSLEALREEIEAQRPLTPRERLERALEEAVQREDYERAAQVRDELKNLTE